MNGNAPSTANRLWISIAAVTALAIPTGYALETTANSIPKTLTPQLRDVSYLTSNNSTLVRDAVTLAHEAGFASIDSQKLRATKSVAVVPLTPTLAVDLKPTTTGAVTDGHVTINGPAADGTVTVAQLGGFGVVTERHAKLEFRYKVLAEPGVTLARSAADGGLDEKTSSGQVIGHLDAAYALDSSGAAVPASYGFDARSNELVVRADTSHAKGSVFVDPSWRCWATAGAYGAAFIVAAFAWIFTDGSVTWAIWALRAWFGLSFNAADSIARACTLH